MRLAFVALLPLALAVVSASCSYINQIGPTSCERGDFEEGGVNEPEDYTEGEVVDGVYQSSDPDVRADGGAGSDGGQGGEGGADGDDGWGGTGTLEQEKQEAELLWFPGGMRYRIFHKLGTTPTWWQAYLSFGRKGAYDGENTLAEAAGNQVEVVDLNDESFVVINGSCSEYYLLVIAGAQKSGP